MDEDKSMSDFAKSVKSIRDNILAHCEYVSLNAKIQKSKYDSLIKEGFTPEQALVLCK